MKKTAPLILLLLFAFNICGYYLWFTVSLHRHYTNVYREIRAGIPDSWLEVIPGAQPGLHWVRTGKEFSLNGEMYDVVRTMNDNGHMVYLCLRDSKEEALIARFSSKARHNSRQERLIKKIPHQVFISHKNTLQSPNRVVGYLQGERPFFYHSCEPEIHSPPPKPNLS